MKLSFCLTALALALQTALCGPCAEAQKDPRYAAPLKTEYRLSGTFAELRPNHFHGGIDMGTGGVENIEVHCAERGWVSRVKVGPFGYGRALYVDHPDGHTTVYAHLNAFSKKIEKEVRRRQREAQNFNVDFSLPQGSIAVERDEVVAYSGNTGGSGAPHLHFEVRDTKTEEPLNPMRFVTTPADKLPPTVYGVKLYAMTDESQVAGRAADHYFDLKNISGKRIEAFGSIGFGIHCTDPAGGSGRPCGIVEAELFDNDKLVFKMRIDHYAFAHTRDLNSHVDYAERQQHKRFIQKAFVAPGNRLPFYKKAAGPTRVAEGETHRMRYVVKDFAGNATTVAFTVVGKRNADAPAKMPQAGTAVARGQEWTQRRDGARVTLPADALYEDTYVEMNRADVAGGTPVFYIGDANVALRNSLTLTLPVPDKWRTRGSQLYIGQLSGNTLSYVGGTLSSDFAANPTITAQSKTFGSFRVDVDSIAPTVVSRNKTHQLRGQHSVMIGISDDKSGIDTYNVYIDGVWQIFEYDYKRARLKATVSDLGLAVGQHMLRAEVTDACGNKKTFDWSFSVIK